MAQQVINVGTTSNSGGGDPLRNAMVKINENFTEVYADIAESPAANLTGALPAIDGSALTGITISELNLPPTTEPNSYGKASDTPGDVVFGTEYLYYCYRAFPRQDDFTATLGINQNSNDFVITEDFTTFPTDIYAGFEVYESDGLTLIGTVESITENTTNLPGKTTVRLVNFTGNRTLGTDILIKYATTAKIWKRIVLGTY